MRPGKTEENEEVQYYNFLDFINCGGCYLLTKWSNEKPVTVTLNKDTILEDLQEKHGGRIKYAKFCPTTFLGYESMNRSLHDKDLDEVINRTNIDPYEGYYDVQLLKALITGEGSKEFYLTPCIVRWPKEGSSRGQDWYRLIKN